MDYQGDERRAPQEQGWHLKREVNLTIIISVIGIAVAVVTGYTDLKKEDALIKADVATLQRNASDADSRQREFNNQMRTQYQLLDAKLDRLIERTR